MSDPNDPSLARDDGLVWLLHPPHQRQRRRQPKKNSVRHYPLRSKVRLHKATARPKAPKSLRTRPSGWPPDSCKSYPSLASPRHIKGGGCGNRTGRRCWLFS